MSEEDGFTIRDEANALTALAFRNGPIENLHAGKHDPVLDDPSVSRITDDEMKEIMIKASERLAELLNLRNTDIEAYAREIENGMRYTRDWDREWPLERNSSKT